jgi:flavorubredoxin
MDKPTALEPYRVAPDVDVVPAYFPVPGLGILPVNAFVIHAAEPVLVDTGLVPLSDEFMEGLGSVIDPADLKWLWLTHTDPDHIGSLARILEAVPGLRVITTYLAVGKMSLFQPLPLDRVYLLNPGEGLSVGDRTLTGVKPPTFDAPETTGFHDPKSNAFFCADCFGALMSEPAQHAADMDSEALRGGVRFWGTVDAPWAHSVEPKRFAAALDRVRKLSAEHILSAHLPPAQGMTDELLSYLAEVPGAAPFVGFNQPALEALLRGAAGE